MVPITRSPCGLRSEVVMRTKSSPWRANTVATPPVSALNLSGNAKLPFNTSPSTDS
jgi:hypothetical protein